MRTVNVDVNDDVKAGQVLAELDTTRLQRPGAAGAELARVGGGARPAKRCQREGSARELRAPAQGARAERQQAAFAAGHRRRRVDGRARRRRHGGGQGCGRTGARQSGRRFAPISSKTEIRSPINGVVLVRSVEPGQTVAASLQAPILFTLAEDLKKMELHVAVDEADVGSVRGRPGGDVHGRCVPEPTLLRAHHAGALRLQQHAEEQCLDQQRSGRQRDDRPAS